MCSNYALLEVLVMRCITHPVKFISSSMKTPADVSKRTNKVVTIIYVIGISGYVCKI